MYSPYQTKKEIKHDHKPWKNKCFRLPATINQQPKLAIQIFLYIKKKMYLSEINIPDWAEKLDPSCMSRSHISQGATNPMLHKQNHHQSSQWLLSHQWKQSHLQPEPLSPQKWNCTHTWKSTAPTAKSENPCSEYIHTSRSELYNIQMVEETITNGNVSVKARFEVY